MMRRDGSIVSANVPSKSRLKSTETEIDSGTYRCMVVKVRYTDDPFNTTFQNKQVTYNCMILGGRREGQVIENCKLVNYLGGEFNYHERVLRATDFTFHGIGSKALPEHTGDIVYVNFVQKNSNPIIIGLGTQPLDLDTTGATISDGPRWIEQYNGIKKEVNKDGDYELTRFGGLYDPIKGFFKPSDEFAARLKFSKNSMIWEDPKNSLEFKELTQEWLLALGDGYTENISGLLENSSREFKSGLKITEDGLLDKVNVVTSGGAKTEVDGLLDKINVETSGGVKASFDGLLDIVTIETSSGAKIEVDGLTKKITLETDAGNSIVINGLGELKITSAVKVNVEAPLAGIGLGAAFGVTLFEMLKAEFAAHTHIAPQAPAGALPTSPPTAPLNQAVGSITVKSAP